jgi:hypothetical protein
MSKSAAALARKWLEMALQQLPQATAEKDVTALAAITVGMQGLYSQWAWPMVARQDVSVQQQRFFCCVGG